MSIDYWGLGLQAVNVLILMWLLSRVFWRPVAAAIATRQQTARTLIEAAQATQAQADAALDEATQARAGIARERAAALEAARAEAEVMTQATVADARTKAQTLLATAKAAAEQDAEAARKANATAATDLALTIAGALLHRMDGPTVQAAFLSQLIEGIRHMPESDRAALVNDPAGVEIVAAQEHHTDAARTEIADAVCQALGGTPDLRFVTDADLIGGLELRSPHFVLHNSWRADLQQVGKAVSHAD